MSVDVLELSRSDAWPDLKCAPGVTPISERDRQLHAPDRSLLLIRDGALVARLSCWWMETAALEGRPVGALGHYAASDLSAGTDLLNAACRLLQQQGLALAVGPMDGNTWRRYRLIVERGTEPPFALEPDNPDEWPEHWTAAGFELLASYASALNDQLGEADARTDDALRRARGEGITIRSIDPERGDAELDRIYDLSLRAFSDNLLYSPIGQNEFLAQYKAVMPSVDPKLVLMAERGGQLLGFMFAFPDFLQRLRGSRVDTVILKTLAVDPSVRGLGLGGALLDLAQREAHRLGFTRAIHALFHEANLSGRISSRYARPIRRYALLRRSLSA
jgi:GNAT superfamily N-acetyltransferase